MSSLLVGWTVSVTGKESVVVGRDSCVPVMNDFAKRKST